MEASGQLHAPVALGPGKTAPYPLARRLGGPPRAGLDVVEKINSFSLPGIEPQPVARRCTD
jgi:uncharacterized protein YbbC (DUF1343 family)